jgi:hypothetical protein
MTDDPDQRTPEISRRNFVGGLVMAAALPAAARDRLAGANPSAAAQTAAPQTAGEIGEPADAANYPPLRTGLRGQYPGSFEVAHQLRDGAYSGAIEAGDTGEHYDLVVVGAGISGLSAAYFYRKALGRTCKILLLDNHDDFGGHAKRNEFFHQGRTYLSFGGSMSIETPFPYSHTAKSHGYAYAYDTLGDPDLPEAERPHVIGRRAFGRITIANADSGAGAFINVAIDQAERAVQECFASRGLI